MENDYKMIMNAPVIIEKRSSLSDFNIRRLWHYRELLYILVWKDIKVRYKQTILGIFWIVLQPIVTMAIFSFIFGYLLKVPSGNTPYPIFTFAAMLPWTYFASSLSRASMALVGNSNLISKVFFPRLLLPLSGVISGLIDFGVAFCVYLVFMVFFSVYPNPAILVLPFLIILVILITFGFSLWFSALNVRYRDVAFIIPFLIQIWMYVTPIIYGSTLIPEQYRTFMILNPMTGVIDGFRWSLLGESAIDHNLLFIECAVSLGISLFVIISGLVYFHKTERSFADII